MNNRQSLPSCSHTVTHLLVAKQTVQAEEFLGRQLSACRRNAESKRKIALRALLAEVRMDQSRSLDAADLVEQNLAAADGRLTLAEASTYARVCRALVRAHHTTRARRLLRALLGSNLPLDAAARPRICTAAKAWRKIPDDLAPVITRYLEAVIKHLGIAPDQLPTSGPLQDRVLSACAAYRAGVDRYSDFLSTPHPADPLQRREAFAAYARREPVRFFREEARRAFQQ